MSLHPWARGPFELILHGEQHFRSGDDFDRRIALISFDNSIEVSITTYLTLKSIHRQNREYDGGDVVKWLKGFHSKVDFFLGECGRRSVAPRVDKTHFAWFHELRNEQYHGGKAAVPEKVDLDGVRDAAVHVFAILFDMVDVEDLLQQRLTPTLVVLDVPQPVPVVDAALDALYGEVEIAGSTYLTSELLFRLDPTAYTELGIAALDDATGPGGQAIAS